MLCLQKDVYAFLLFDAIWMYALALNKSLAAGVSVNDTRGIAKRLFGTHFTSWSLVFFVSNFSKHNMMPVNVLLT